MSIGVSDSVVQWESIDTIDDMVGDSASSAPTIPTLDEPTAINILASSRFRGLSLAVSSEPEAETKFGEGRVNSIGRSRK
jgi:hypothetical protein